VLLLLHHMFLEQVPVMLSTLKLLAAWVRQQQQQQQQQQDGQRGSSSGGWLQVPRFLGKTTFTLYHPATGAAPAPPSAAPLQRFASSYVAWRAAEIVGWYLQLQASDQAAVQELLQEVTGVAAEGSGSSSGGSSAGGGSSRGTGSEGQGDVGSEGQSDVAAVAAGGLIDAVAAFGELVQCVGECGRIERRANRVVVWCGAPCQPASRL
jgi:hypothetical protein